VIGKERRRDGVGPGPEREGLGQDAKMEWEMEGVERLQGGRGRELQKKDRLRRYSWTVWMEGSVGKVY
jgi:hypothetical protein